MGPKTLPRAPKVGIDTLNIYFEYFYKHKNTAEASKLCFLVLVAFYIHLVVNFQKWAPKSDLFWVWSPKYQFYDFEPGIYWKVM